MIRSFIMVAASLLSGPVLAQTFTPLFNGTSLAGWKTQGQGTWEVREGAIHGSGLATNPKNAWLISDKAAYQDFDFRFSFMGVTGNSGLNFRSIQGTEDVTGMQVDIDNGRTTGGLYEVIVRDGQYAGAYVAQPPASQIQGLYKAADWNVVELKVRGKHAEVSLNGTRVVNHDLARVEAQGFFAFQIHDKQVSKISLKDLAVAEVTTAVLPRFQSRASLREHAGLPALRAWDLSGRRLPPGPAGSFRYILPNRAEAQDPEASSR